MTVRRDLAKWGGYVIQDREPLGQIVLADHELQPPGAGPPLHLVLSSPARDFNIRVLDDDYKVSFL